MPAPPTRCACRWFCAAAAFGSSVGIVRAVVTVFERELGATAIASIEYGRQLFTMGTMPLVKSGEVLSADLSVDDLVKMLSPRELRLVRACDGVLAQVEPIELGLADRSVKMAVDDRPLPAALAAALRADTASDLDIFSIDDDPLRDRYREVMEQIEQGGADVVRDVADIVDAYDAAAALQESDARPLYCVNMVARAMVGRFDGDPSTRYRKLPDTAFDARSTLCRLLREQGDEEGSLQLARELVELAPTSFTAYHSLAMTYRELDRDDEAVRALVDGLKVSVAPMDVAAAYYRLGFLLWQAGNPALGLACYVQVPRDTYFYGETQVEMATSCATRISPTPPRSRTAPRLAAIVRDSGGPGARRGRGSGAGRYRPGGRRLLRCGQRPGPLPVEHGRGSQLPRCLAGGPEVPRLGPPFTARERSLGESAARGPPPRGRLRTYGCRAGSTRHLARIFGAARPRREREVSHGCAQDWQCEERGARRPRRGGQDLARGRRMLHLSGRTARLGGHGGTKPTLDYDAEEVKREFSISTSIAPIDWKGARINVLDAPCYPDFIGDAYAAMSVCETALFVVDAAEGPQPTTVKLWYAAEDLRLARAVFINRVDKENADHAMCMEMLRERFGMRLGAVTLPWGTGGDFHGIIDLVRMKARTCDGTKQTEYDIPEELRAEAEAADETPCELVAEADDALTGEVPSRASPSPRRKSRACSRRLSPSACSCPSSRAAAPRSRA